MNKRISADSSDLSGFEADAYLAINEARWRVAQSVLDALAVQGAAPKSVYDFGCGPGWFAAKLAARGLDVVGLDARAAVIEAARSSAPAARFEVFDFDAAGLSALPPARDFTLCFGILYHLENPMRALRILRALTKGAAMIETMTYPSDEPTARLVRENDNATQGVRELALILSASAVEYALLAAGFAHVYRYVGVVDHPDFIESALRHRRRHMIMASDEPLSVPGFDASQNCDLQRADYWKKP